MTNQRHLKNAPIKEAIIDIQAATTITFDSPQASELTKELEAEYPNKVHMRRREFGFEDQSGGAVKTSHVDHGIWGWRIESEDGYQIAQFRRDGFTFSRLAPYETWEDMFAEAMRLWDRFSGVACPAEITRIATRFINVLELPLPSQLGGYLTAPPQVPGEFESEISSFLTRTVFAAPDYGAQVIFTQALDSIKANASNIILDIDVFIENIFDPSNCDFREKLNTLRGLKNDVFFDSITERTAEQYQ